MFSTGNRSYGYNGNKPSDLSPNNSTKSNRRGFRRTSPRYATPLTPPAEKKLRLLPLIAEYRAKGYITAVEEMDFMKRLEKSPRNPFDQSHVKNIENELRQIAEEHNGIELGKLPQMSKVIFESSDFMDQADEDTMQHWFVELCFFARLGFLQPPSCLKCLYREAIDGVKPVAGCQNQLMWRKNAKALLHPQRLSGNLCLVECHAVRKLLEGQIVDSYEWDKEKKELIYHM